MIQLTPQSFVTHAQKVLKIPKSAFEALWDFGMDDDKVPPSFAMGQRMHRKQATFGAGYSFSRQKNSVFLTPESEFPEAVRMALEHAREISSTVNGVHVNWYPGGKAGVLPHADDEPELVPEAPIFSYTLLESDEAPPRGFQIYLGDETKPVADIQLRNGDLVIMGGKMQQECKHGVKKSAAKAFVSHRRINITVRTFRSV
jgi:alkylated DNA repair dioxygenase AlkB